MNKTYLDKDRITELRDYLNSVLSTKIRGTLLQFKLKSGLELYYDTKDNKKVLWKYYNDELYYLNDVLSSEFRNVLSNGNHYKGGEILSSYIEKHYKNEWSILDSFDPTGIENHLNWIGGFTRKNNIDRIWIKEVIECQSIDDFLSRYDKKNVDPELLKKTEMIKKSVDIFYKDVKYGSDEYWTFTNSVNVYIETKDEQILHNMLNQN